MLLTVVIVRTAVHTRFYDVTQLRMLLLSNFPGSLLYIPRTSDGCQLEYFSGNVIKLRAVYEFVFQTVLSGDLQIRRDMHGIIDSANIVPMYTPGNSDGNRRAICTDEQVYCEIVLSPVVFYLD